ncbi:hypothetical protein HT749_33185 [Burkholderia cepacia]|uniref:hypothetical protein n=1 Tax=Burkholderia cepacia TaxID=292 RepID=UPI0012D8E1A1|nr:hypothetical protein [Burkholderia cepacia]NTX48244.1 hypothetical protein [Burkholderia cepacia]
MSDFSPVSQDRYCVVILKMKRKALDFIKSGDLSKAVFQANCKLEWASFPGAPYDQGGVGWEDLNAKFTTFVREERAGKSDLAASRGALNDLID